MDIQKFYLFSSWFWALLKLLEVLWLVGEELLNINRKYLYGKCISFLGLL